MMMTTKGCHTHSHPVRTTLGGLISWKTLARAPCPVQQKYEHYKKLYQDSSWDSERQQRDAKKRESELREELKVMECEAQEHHRSVGILKQKHADKIKRISERMAECELIL